MKLLFKNSFKKVRKSIGRFLSVLFIVALGVGFFAGLRETSPDMISTIDKYYDNTNLMDFKIISTKGLTKDDVSSLKKLDNTYMVVPSYSIDVLSEGKAVRMHAIENEINTLDLISGKMPVNENECLAEDGKYQIGDTITVSADNLNNNIKNNKYKVVGLIHSPLYISKEKGIANIGNGKLDSYIFIPKSNFITDYYTEIYLTAKGTKKTQSYSEEYDKLASDLEKQLLELKPIRETKRYEEILEAATKKINEAENILYDEKESTEKTLENTKKQLDANLKKINAGLNELNIAEQQVYAEQKINQAKIDKGNQELNVGRNNYNSALNASGLNETTLKTTISGLKSKITDLEKMLSNLDKDSDEYKVVANNLSEVKKQYSSLVTLEETKKTLDQKEKKLKQSQSTLDQSVKKSLNKIYNERQILNNNKDTLNNAYSEYNAGISELNEKVSKAENDIKSAKEELNNMEKPKWYLLDRLDNTGYAYFNDDASKVESISKVFPIFFILVAALMCLNTMTRMIEEERTEIGIMSSLGYSRFKIIINYIFYVLIATIGGIGLGLLIGYTAIPKIIYSIYNSNYVIPDLIVGAKPVPFTIIVNTTIALMTIVTIIACYKELKNKPAVLLRPKSPKKGKKVFLEYIKFIWKKLSFTWKVTVRNMFRYKQRIIMTVVGIAGCTALLLTGLGLRDGIHNLAKTQYGGIIKYDSLIVLKNEIENVDNNFEKQLKENHVNSYSLINQESYTFNENNKNHDAYLIVSKENDLSKYVNLTSTKDGKKINLSDKGVVISEKMAKLLKVQIGDSIKIRNSENELFMVRVSNITKNYTMHYIYMDEEYYKKTFDKELKYNMLMANLTDDNNDEIANSLIDGGNVSTVNFISDNVKTFDDMVNGLNKIIVLIVGAASLLAFIVLYNLTTINITERIREIATLKVLGFYDKEVSSYVYRETLMLTLIGAIIGLLMGAGLERFVILTAETDNIMFLTDISPLSYVLAFIITIIFSIIVQVFTGLKLKKVDMIESLKSVE